MRQTFRQEAREAMVRQQGDTTTSRTRGMRGHGADNEVTQQPAEKEAREAMAQKGGGGSGRGCG